MVRIICVTLLFYFNIGDVKNFDYFAAGIEHCLFSDDPKNCIKRLELPDLQPLDEAHIVSLDIPSTKTEGDSLYINYYEYHPYFSHPSKYPLPPPRVPS